MIAISYIKSNLEGGQSHPPDLQAN